MVFNPIESFSLEVVQSEPIIINPLPKLANEPSEPQIDIQVLGFAQSPVGIIHPGETVTYSMKIKNNGQDNATGIVITLNHPEFVYQGSNSDCGAGKRLTQCFFPESFVLAPSKSVSVSLQYLVPSSMPSGNFNLSADSFAKGTETNREDNSSFIVTIVESHIDLSVLRILQDPDIVIKQGQTIQYTVEVRNYGKDAANGIKLQLEHPPEFVYQNNNPDCTDNGSGITSCIFPETTILTPQNGMPVYLKYLAPTTMPAGTYAVTATSSANGDEMNPNDDSLSVTTTIEPLALALVPSPQLSNDLPTIKSDPTITVPLPIALPQVDMTTLRISQNPSDSITQGQTIHYTVDVGNFGRDEAEKITLQFVHTSEMVYQNNNSNCTDNGGGVTICVFPDTITIPPERAMSVNLDYLVPVNLQVGTYSVTATPSAAGQEMNPNDDSLNIMTNVIAPQIEISTEPQIGNNLPTINTGPIPPSIPNTIINNVDLTINWIGHQESAIVNKEMDSSFIITNNLDTWAYNVRYNLLVSSGIEFVIPLDANCTEERAPTEDTDGFYVCQIGDLPPSQNTPYSYPLKLKFHDNIGTAGFYLSVYSDGVDVDTENNLTDLIIPQQKIEQPTTQVFENKKIIPEIITQPSSPTLQNPTIAQPPKVPVWIKQNAKWWSNEQIDDSEFVSGIEYLAKENIINLSTSKPSAQAQSRVVPDWIKQNAQWWANDVISEKEFVLAMEYLAQKGIIHVSKEPSCTNPFGSGTDEKNISLSIRNKSNSPYGMVTYEIQRPSIQADVKGTLTIANCEGMIDSIPIKAPEAYRSRGMEYTIPKNNLIGLIGNSFIITGSNDNGKLFAQLEYDESINGSFGPGKTIATYQSPHLTHISSEYTWYDADIFPNDKPPRLIQFIIPKHPQLNIAAFDCNNCPTRLYDANIAADLSRKIINGAEGQFYVDRNSSFKVFIFDNQYDETWSDKWIPIIMGEIWDRTLNFVTLGGYSIANTAFGWVSDGPSSMSNLIKSQTNSSKQILVAYAYSESHKKIFPIILTEGHDGNFVSESIKVSPISNILGDTIIFFYSNGHGTVVSKIIVADSTELK